MRTDNTEYIPGCIVFPFGYRVIAETVFGDAICINLNRLDASGQPEVVLASHDILNEEVAEAEDLEAGLRDVAPTFKQFFHLLVKGDVPKYFYD
jgi:hypothetical protein